MGTVNRILVGLWGLGTLVGLAGCATNATVARGSERVGTYFGDLGITGNGNNVTVLGDSRLRKVSFIGDNNVVNVADRATIAHIEFFGKNNTITIPASLMVRMTEWGRGNTVVRRPEVWDDTIQEETVFIPRSAEPPAGMSESMSPSVTTIPDTSYSASPGAAQPPPTRETSPPVQSTPGVEEF